MLLEHGRNLNLTFAIDLLSNLIYKRQRSQRS
jgi:hypothetical protein